MSTVTLRLGWPPSVNTYWRRHGHTIYLSQQGKQYKADVKRQVASIVSTLPRTARLGVQIELAGRTRRKYDLDNYAKCILDSLKGELFDDDEQVDQLIVKRLPVDPPGYADVLISELEPQGDE